MDPETGMFAFFNLSRPNSVDRFVHNQRTGQDIAGERDTIQNLRDDNYKLKGGDGNFGFGSLIIGQWSKAQAKNNFVEEKDHDFVCFLQQQTNAPH